MEGSDWPTERLIQAAQPHNASLGQSRNRCGRSANFHSILGGESDDEDDSDDEEDPQAALEVYCTSQTGTGSLADERNARETIDSTRSRERRLNNER